MHRTCRALASLLVLAACASEPRRPPASLDPSNPDAPESPPVSPPDTLTAPAPLTPSFAQPRGANASRHGAEAPASARDAGTRTSGHVHEGAPSRAPARDAGSATVYVCPMHPEVRSETPGTCPKCGMRLEPERPPADAGQPRPAPSGHEHGHGGRP
ncbi:heavy metal-binding domain-containing protein [Pyxidicoccus fallax]|uniref:heavy metal-binding domain-containing protein n=1 Tax=Pyxidicoccus fallax TaxID=394095 RepID=UPI0035313788